MKEKVPYDFRTHSQGVAVTVLGSLSESLLENRYFILFIFLLQYTEVK